jgi:hypothetical protein
MSKSAPLRTAEIGDFAVPRHVAIISGRQWTLGGGARLPRGKGTGVSRALRRTVRAAGDLGIGFLTIFPSAPRIGRAARRN